MGPKERLVVKTRLKHLLTNQTLLERLRDGVRNVHSIATDAYNLIKLDILTIFQRKTQGQATFDHQVARAVTDSICLRKAYIETALKAAMADTSTGRPCKQEAQTTVSRLKALHKQHQGLGSMPMVKTCGTNTSAIMNYLATEMLTAYKNNVWMHFTKYPKRYIRTVMLREEARQGVETQWQLPQEDRQRIIREAAAITDSVLYSSTPHPQYQHLAPPVRSFVTNDDSNSAKRLYDLKVNPERYIPYMLHINRQFQAMGARMYSPLSLKTTFIPGHLHLDTQAVVDLLVHDKAAIATMKAGLEGSTIPGTDATYDLRNLNGKADLVKQITGLVAPSQVALVSNSKAAPHFRTAIWQQLTKVGSHKHAPRELEGMVFNNMITTDGYSVSLHYVRKDLFGVTKYNAGGRDEEEEEKPKPKGKGKAKGKKVDEFHYVQKLDGEVNDRLLSDKTTLLWADPGKGALLTVGKVLQCRCPEGAAHCTCSHGIKTVQYTGRQCREESSQTRNQKERNAILQRDLGVGSLLDIQIHLGAEGASHSSCDLDSFTAYLKRRYGSHGALLNQVYSSWIFRRQKFRAFSGRKSSEDKFLNRVISAFKEEGKELVSLYGNWGKNPNLKHQPPTPGIGLRRNLHSRIKTFTVDERRTSSVCHTATPQALNTPSAESGR
eukprot:jgi/Chrzof1/7995/UNPLg00046.t1